MIYRSFLFLVGRCRFYVTHDIMRVINSMARENIGADNLHMENGVLVFDLPLFRKRRLDRLFEKHGFSYDKYTLSGIPHYALIYRKRAGLLLGIVLLIALVYTSSSFVWRIDVIGNESLDDSTVTDGLAELGFGVGSYIPSVNVKLLANEYLLKHPELAWMSINIIGNCVDIRVREALIQEDEPDIKDNTPSVLVASRDGFIERIELENGEIIKNVGQTVREGETIVSGFVEMPDGSFRLVRSAAKVYAKTSHSFTVEIPYIQDTQTVVPLDSKSYSIIFFSSLIRLPAISSPEKEGALSQDRAAYLSLPGGITLPVGIMTRTYCQTDQKQIIFDKTEAEAKAREEISRIISDEFKNAEVLSIALTPAPSEDSFILDVTLTCIEDIASERVITTANYK